MAENDGIATPSGGIRLRLVSSMNDLRLVASMVAGATIDVLTPYTGSRPHRAWMHLRDYVYPYTDSIRRKET